MRNCALVGDVAVPDEGIGRPLSRPLGISWHRVPPSGAPDADKGKCRGSRLKNAGAAASGFLRKPHHRCGLICEPGRAGACTDGFLPRHGDF